MDTITYPLDTRTILRKKKSLKRLLLQEKQPFEEKKIAVLGGSTTDEVTNILELFLLHRRIKPTFYQSEYNHFYQDAVFSNDALNEFQPDLIYVHTSYQNVESFPKLDFTSDDSKQLLDSQVAKFCEVWDQAMARFSCPIIQNNFDYPPYRNLGNLEAVDHRGAVRFIRLLNEAFAQQASGRSYLHINDINYLAATIGLDQWHYRPHWYAYKYTLGFDEIPHLALQISNIVAAIYGRSSKCLVLDLDNTIWHGVIGDDGLGGIGIGQDTPEGEAFHDIQTYCESLHGRGVMLSVCSKNEPENARLGLTHPDSLLKEQHFSIIKANWEPKDGNIEDIAQNINIGLDSLVFLDDNAAERDLVRSQLPDVAVPEIGQDPADFVRILDHGGYFETVSLSGDDLLRNQSYRQEVRRQTTRRKFKDHRAYLESLAMSAEIMPFQEIYLERITQLINKTNQFNLTTKRMTHAEVESCMENPDYITLYGRLNDRFGDNGLVSVVIAQKIDACLHMHIWLMSCRVLKRDLELAMLDELVSHARNQDVDEIRGYYFKTAKNGLVSQLFDTLQFECVHKTEDASEWRLEIRNYQNQNSLIKVNQ